MDETSPTMAMLPEYECWQLLQSHRPRLGRLAFVDAGWPLVLPVNYLAVGTLLYIRTAPGSKLLAAAKLQQVTFEVDDVDEVREEGGASWPSDACGWSPMRPRCKTSGSDRSGRGHGATASTCCGWMSPWSPGAGCCEPTPRPPLSSVARKRAGPSRQPDEPERRSAGETEGSRLACSSRGCRRRRAVGLSRPGQLPLGRSASSGVG